MKTDKLLKVLKDNNVSQKSIDKLASFRACVYNAHQFVQIKTSECFGTPNLLFESMIKRINIYRIKDNKPLWRRGFSYDSCLYNINIYDDYAFQALKKILRDYSDANGDITEDSIPKVIEFIIDNLKTPTVEHSKKYQLLACVYIIMSRARMGKDAIKYKKRVNKNKELISESTTLYQFLKEEYNETLTSNEIRIYTNFAKEFLSEINDCYNSHQLTKYQIMGETYTDTTLSESSARRYFTKYIHAFPVKKLSELDIKAIEKEVVKRGYKIDAEIKITDALQMFKSVQNNTHGRKQIMASLDEGSAYDYEEYEFIKNIRNNKK